MSVQGPDSGYSWVIVLSCAYIHFALFGLFRSAGVMYVALLQHFDVTREEASWPFSLCSAVFQLIGPVASVFTHYMSQRRACLLGSAIATLGVACCYFAESVLWINVFYGLVHGLGFGLTVTIVPVIVNQYFVKHRATAIGIAFSGGTVSSFIFPVFLEWMLETYSLKGSFLLMSGIVMNTLVASSLLRAPPWLKKHKHTNPVLAEDPCDARDSGVSTGEMDRQENQTGFSTAEGMDGSTKEDSPFVEKFAVVGQDGDVNESQQDHSSGDLESENLDTVYSNNDSILFGGSNSKINAISTSGTTFKNYKSNDRNKTDQEVHEPLMRGKQVFIMPKQSVHENEEKGDKFKCTILHSVTNILKQPMFHLITFTMCIYFLAIHSFFMVIVDFAKDKGIPENRGIYIMSVFSVTDLIGRAGLGWVTDRNYISRKNMVILNLTILGVLNQIYPIVNSLTSMLVISAFHGLAVGCSITLFFVLQAEYMGMKRLTLVIGLTSFINGISVFLRPLMIGLFRDVIGSYNWMFHFLGMILFVFSLIWLIESWMTKDKKIPNSSPDSKV